MYDYSPKWKNLVDNTIGLEMYFRNDPDIWEKKIRLFKGNYLKKTHEITPKELEEIL